MNLIRPQPKRTLISLVSMIDVLLIMLVFFMVTSTYANLDMIPVVQSNDDVSQPISAESVSQNGETILIRITASGRIMTGGQSLKPDDLQSVIQAKIQDAPTTPILILPSGHANTQALISVMDSVTLAGAQNMRIVQLQARP